MRGYRKSLKAAGCVLLALLGLCLVSCQQQPEMEGGSLALSIVDSKSILPANTRVTWVSIRGTRNNDSSIMFEPQFFELGQPIAINGLSVGTWTFTVTGYNGDPSDGGKILTRSSSDSDVEIKSGKTTTASFALQYLTQGYGTAKVTVTWPNGANLAVKGTLTSGSTTVDTTVALSTSGSSVLSYTSLAVGDYDVKITMINPSGTTISFPMMDMVNVFSELESIGTIALEAVDFPKLGTPTLDAGSETTSSGDTVYAYRLVTLSVPKSGSSLYYTTDGNEPGFIDSDETMVPDISTTKYTEPFELKATDSAVTTTVKAIATKDGYLDSQVATDSYTVNGIGGSGTIITQPALVSNVTLTQDAMNPLQFSVSYDTQGTPGETLSWYVDTEDTVAVDMDNDTDSKTFTSDLLTEGRHQVIVRIAYMDGDEAKTAFVSKRFDVSQTGVPVIDLSGGDTQSVTLTSATEGATIYYRYATGGDDPSGAYTEGTSFTVTVGLSLKVEAYATNDGLEASAIVSANYEPATIPTFSPSSATFTDTQEVTMASAAGSTIYYTTDGTTIPTTSSSSLISGGSITVSSTTTIQAMAVKIGMVNSTTAEGTYTQEAGYKIGDEGPAGGIIFYVNTDHTYGSWTYLEAAKTDEGTYKWGGFGTEVTGTSEAIGTGETNTEAIVTVIDKLGETNYAAKVCYDKTVTFDGTTYDDWFLPSLNELEKMYLNLFKNKLGNFKAEDFYLSSYERSQGEAWGMPFTSEETFAYTGKTTDSANFHVRAIRSF
ncbi:chitobiase/beta-hexosaminidase C-terminal domain-containing protein [uncultured Sphaerochaeta sp.]|uniref:chitobiase/beta-hexosaminidase C-terminal domain-containing protein n=1 Tax=uncultured Sphaerochaeta sp. TaxID=886478 RepID=UPI002A0A98AF|nr:chitobiase/beta-hexosaminidase C-terminal domain-containing protein [uncultured Sphaerochaeta sp.]